MFEKQYYEKDNRGNRHDTLEKAHLYWMNQRFCMEKKAPFVLFKFNNPFSAQQALLSLPFIHRALDTGKLICDRVMEFGYYPVDIGIYEAIVCGFDLTYEEFQFTELVFQKFGGVLKNHLEPSRFMKAYDFSNADKTRVKFKTINKKDKFTYEIYEGKTRADAMAFLGDRVVNQKLYYVIVETPEGNFGRDNMGIYEE